MNAVASRSGFEPKLAKLMERERRQGESWSNVILRLTKEEGP
jgi:hypothetical protein